MLKKSWCKGIFYLDLNKFGKLINRIFKKILYKLNIYFNLLWILGNLYCIVSF